MLIQNYSFYLYKLLIAALQSPLGILAVVLLLAGGTDKSGLRGKPEYINVGVSLTIATTTPELASTSACAFVGVPSSL